MSKNFLDSSKATLEPQKTDDLSYDLPFPDQSESKLIEDQKLPEKTNSDLIIKYLSPFETAKNSLEKEGQEIIYGLTQKPKSLPPKYFYDDQGSQLFEKICELPEYYPTRTEASILQESASEIAEITGECELIELGSGSSTKTRLLLDAYHQQENPCQYVPIDVSQGILEASIIQLKEEYSGIKIEGLVGTYEQALTHLSKGSRRMIFFLGSSIGNFNSEECDRFLNQVTQVLDQGDYFLLGIDLQKPESILEAAYNDTQGVTAAFNLNMLSHLNWRFQGNFEPHFFNHQAIYNLEKNQIEMYLTCQKSQIVHLQKLNLTVDFDKGERIMTEISRKFDLEIMEKELESKGLKTLKTFTDSQKWFGLILCKKH